MNKWDNIEQWFKEQSRSQNWEFLKESEWFEKWLKTFVQSVETQSKNREHKEENSSIKESKTQLEVIYKLPQQVIVEDILLFVREDCVKLEGLPNDARKIIRLPSLVRPQHCKAVYKDGYLRIRLAKRDKPMKYYLHDITN